MMATLPFAELWAGDFEFSAAPGENPEPVCFVAWELRSGRKVRLWRDAFGAAPPYPTGAHALFIAYYASAELSCHLALGWPVPERVLDLFTEFRNRTNGAPTGSGAGLLGALAFHGLDGIGAIEKNEMRALVLRGGPWSDAERAAILDYCESDVAALARLLPAMLPEIDLPRALLRGRSMAAVARMERTGVPIDTVTLGRLKRHWAAIQDQLIAEIDSDYIDSDYGVFAGRTFKADRFAAWLGRTGIPWPRLTSGRLDLSDDAFREAARTHPTVAPLRELRSALSEMRLSDLAVGRDGRNRTLLSPFRARTGRNQPSNTRFIFGPSVWLRGLIQPPPGHGVAYIDWAQQEFGIAAALSGDPLMRDAYLSGDPYLAFAKQAGAVPAEATKATHKAVREQFKACVLAVQYDMGADSLALDDADREALRLLAENLPAVWKAPATTADERKRILRFIIRAVVLDQKRTRGQVWLKILWQTGAATEHGLQRCVQSYDGDYAELDRLRQRVTVLNAAGKMDKEIAAALNEEGLRAARGRSFTDENVWLLRQRWGISTVKINGVGANPSQWPDGTYSVQGAAVLIGVTPQTIFDYLAAGLLAGRQHAKGQPWQIDLSTPQLDDLRKRLQRTRRSKKEAS